VGECYLADIFNWGYHLQGKFFVHQLEVSQIGKTGVEALRQLHTAAMYSPMRGGIQLIRLRRRRINVKQSRTRRWQCSWHGTRRICGDKSSHVRSAGLALQPPHLVSTIARLSLVATNELVACQTDAACCCCCSYSYSCHVNSVRPPSPPHKMSPYITRHSVPRLPAGWSEGREEVRWEMAKLNMISSGSRKNRLTYSSDSRASAVMELYWKDGRDIFEC